MKSFLRQRGYQIGLAALTIYMVLSSGCSLINNAPVIDSLTTERKAVIQAQSIPIVCLASDPDEDELDYQWLATEGSFSGEGADVIWTAPEEPGSYLISVKVMDGRGGESTMTLILEVLANRPPVIESLNAKGSSINPDEPVAIECIASDPDGDELSYYWTASGGNISGESPLAIWMAPDDPDIYTITVTVTDVRGGEVSEELFMRRRSKSG
jgi:hypothetical protein